MRKVSGKIGFFDSGLGGLTILKEAVERLPGYSYVYLGDNMNAPYGDKTNEEIFAHTLDGIRWLFAEGAELIVLACNTASAVALRRIQQETLPDKYPDKKVLGIIIPTSEEADKFSTTKHIGILATEATVNSGAFEKEVAKESPQSFVTSQAGGRLVELIECDADAADMKTEIIRSVSRLLRRDDEIDVLILGCTHYALIAELIRECLPAGVRIINEAPLVTQKLLGYLAKHREVETRLSRTPSVEIWTTSSDVNTVKLMNKFYGSKIEVKQVKLPNIGHNT